MTGRWRLLSDDGASAARGLALDEALMARYGRGAAPRPPTLRLYSYRDHCALVGRFQNLEAEVDLEACAASGVQVGRRMSGGGAIVMGSGQLGVAYVDRAPSRQRPREAIKSFSEAIVNSLALLDVPASFQGKNDVEVRGRKIAGLGVHVDGEGAMILHASILADLDISQMLRLLRIPAAKLGRHGAAAVADRLTTVTEQTGRVFDAASLRPFVARGFAQTFGVVLDEGEPDELELALAAHLVQERYGSPTWLNERSVTSDASGSAILDTPLGLVSLYLTTQADLVKSAMVVGDFNELPPALAAMESALRWQRLDEGTLRSVVVESGAAKSLGVATQLVVDTLLEAGRQTLERVREAPVRVIGSRDFPEAEGVFEVGPASRYDADHGPET